MIREGEKRTLSIKPYSTASSGVKYLVRLASLSTSSMFLPHAFAKSEQVTRRFASTCVMCPSSYYVYTLKEWGHVVQRKSEGNNGTRDKEKDRQTRLTDWETDRQTGRQTYRQTDKERDI